MYHNFKLSSCYKNIRKQQYNAMYLKTGKYFLFMKKALMGGKGGTHHNLSLFSYIKIFYSPFCVLYPRDKNLFRGGADNFLKIFLPPLNTESAPDENNPGTQTLDILKRTYIKMIVAY